nr:MAG TPA: hypothetical protein [Caudoviricetes sp.]
MKCIFYNKPRSLRVNTMCQNSNLGFYLFW